MVEIADTLPLASAPVAAPAVEATEIDLLGFEVTPELREQFGVWKKETLSEVLSYLHTNWQLTEVTLDKLVLKPQFVFPDRKNRNLYGQVAPGKSFTNAKGEIIPHPETGQPMLFTVWRRVDPPASAEASEAPKPEISEPANAVTAAAAEPTTVVLEK